MALRSIQLRWRGRCCRCGRILAVGEHADFDTVHHELWCDGCTSGQLELPLPEPVAPPGPVPAPATSSDERARIRQLIDETKATLHAHTRAS